MRRNARFVWLLALSATAGCATPPEVKRDTLL
jgi:hypothetical protein